MLYIDTLTTSISFIHWSQHNDYFLWYCILVPAQSAFFDIIYWYLLIDDLLKYCIWISAQRLSSLILNKYKVRTEVLDEFRFANCSNRREDAKRCGSSIRFMWQLWSHNQHKKDWGSISASTWKALQGAYHHSESSTIASGRQVHLFWKHIV